MKLSRSGKQRLAVRYVAGVPLADLYAEFSLTEAELDRLRAHDEWYQAAEAVALDVAWTEAKRLLRAHAQTAVKALEDLATLDPHNVVETAGPNGGVVLKRKVDPQLVRESRRAAEGILSLWLQAKTLQDRAEARLERFAMGG